MFHEVARAIPSDLEVEVHDILLDPPAEQPYTVLKEFLISRTQSFEKELLRLLLGAEELGDKSPSQFLRQLEQLLSTATIHE